MKMVFSGIPIKFLVMLRDPVARAYSQYQMALDTSGTPEQMKLRGLSSYSGKSFEEVIESEIATCENAGLTVGCSHDPILIYYQPETSFEDFQKTFLPSLPMQHGGHSIILRGLYALQLQPWLQSFPNQIKILSINDLKGSKSKVYYSMFHTYSI